MADEELRTIAFWQNSATRLAKQLATAKAALEITTEERDEARKRLEELGFSCMDEGCPHYNTPHSHKGDAPG